MSSSKSSPKTTTTTSDLRTTNTLNAGLSGDISEALVAAGNYGDTALSSTQISDYSDRSFSDESDNSLNVEMSDNSDRSSSWSDYSDRSFSDASDNSLNVDMNDSSDRSFSDSSDNSFRVDMQDSSNRSIDNSVTNVTDGGAFALVQKMGGDVIETLGESQTEMLGTVNKVVGSSYDFVSDSQDSLFGAVEKLITKALDSSTDIATQSLQGAMQIKAGQTVTEPVNQTMRELAGTATKIAVVGGAIYLGSKFIGSRA